MFLESTMPKELQVYVLIGTFLISLFIDLVFYVKRKELKFFTFSNYGILAWLMVFTVVSIDSIYGFLDYWKTGKFSFYVQIASIFFPPITYSFLQYLAKTHPKIKFSNEYIDIFTYLESRRGPNKWHIPRYKGEIEIDWVFSKHLEVDFSSFYYIRIS